MLIPDTLRQEHMPQMVYNLCKLSAEMQLSREELQKYMTASFSKKYKEKSDTQFNLIFAFAKNAQFISEENDIVRCNFSKGELLSYKEFTYSILKKLSISEGKFNTMLQWYLEQDVVVENTYTGSAREFRNRAIDDPRIKALGIEEDDVHGFFFWIEAFNIAMFEKYRSGNVLFCLENLLIIFLDKHPELKEYGSISVKEFMNKLQEDIYFIPYCYDESSNKIRYSMAQALRILDNLGWIRLEYVKDSARTWHLPKSGIFTKTNSITNIRVMR